MLDNNGEEASKYLSRFAKLVRLILENSRKEYVSIQMEIQTLEYYMELQALRFKNKFDYSIEVSPDLALANILIPPMLAQPFIENAIEHGIKHKDTKGKINIKFSKGNNLVLCEIEDDGIGRKKAEEYKKQSGHKSLGMEITAERLELFNWKIKQKIELVITDIKNADQVILGTKATFSIPFVLQSENK